MAAHSSILAWRIPWTEEPGGYSPWGHKESDNCAHAYIHTHTHNTYIYGVIDENNPHNIVQHCIHLYLCVQTCNP